MTSVYDVPFIKNAHTSIGHDIGLSTEQIEAAVSGTIPAGFTETETVIYLTAFRLVRARGALDKESWEKAEAKLGRVGASRLGHVVAWFLYNATLLSLRAADVL